MLETNSNSLLPAIPEKRYFAIGEVSELCEVKPHVLRYWEQEFPNLKPVKRRGNRRYYRYEDVVTIRQIKNLLYSEGYTIGGARLQMTNAVADSVSKNRLRSVKNTQINKVMIKKMIRELEEIALMLGE